MSPNLRRFNTRLVSNHFAPRLLLLITLLALLGLSFAALPNHVVNASKESHASEAAIPEPSHDSSLMKDVMSKLRLNVAPYSSALATPNDPPGLQSGDLLVGAVNGGIDTGAIF